MAEGTTAVTNKSELHFRLLPELSGTVRRVMSEVLIVKGSGIVNPRCILILVSAGNSFEGPNAQADLQGMPYAVPAGSGKTNKEGVL